MLSIKNIVTVVAASVAIPICVLLTVKVVSLLNEGIGLLHNVNLATETFSESAKTISNTAEGLANNFNNNSDGIFAALSSILNACKEYIEKYGFAQAMANIGKAMGGSNSQDGKK